ncbi:unnamed protein product [Rhizoctonia solani]|uniref:Uncharacterized protein n=1 Tax=Rhizoctonia solani TaxID=456999 RepID=A0A8H2XB14_9AGAM|nr:unnamed protein product [Rhizoctonia solani]
MFDATHSRWGRPFDLYTSSYNLTAAKTRKPITPPAEAEAVKSISKVVQLGGAAQQPDQDKAEAVTIQVLESILEMSLCPRTFHHLAVPPLISGCVKLMNTMQVDGRTSPFRYEYGYLCFKIITIAIGVSILQRTENLDMTVANMESDVDTELMLILSGHVSRVLKYEIEANNGTQACGWVLGWARVQNRPRLQLGPLILRADIRSILSILWDDRELFLKTFMITHSPGLSGVIFILWRYLYSDSLFHDTPPSHLLAAPLCEILWRYLLVATTDQIAPLVYINNDLQLTDKAEIWNESPKYVNLDDLRIIIQAYIGRMAPIDPRSHGPLEIGAIAVLLNFVTKVMQPGVEIFVPSLFGLTLDRIWDALDSLNAGGQETVGHIGAILSLFGRLVEPLNHTYYANRVAVLELVKTLAERDLLDMIARTMLLLEPYSVEPSPAYDKNMEFLENATALVLYLESVVPKHLLESQFVYYLFNWIKVDQHFFALERLFSQGISPYARHFQACRRVWYQISESLAIESRIKKLRFSCFYPRTGAIVAWTAKLSEDYYRIGL